MTDRGEVRIERRVAAPPETVYDYLTDAGLWARWQGISASVDARPGGVFLMRMANGMEASGEFVELVRHRRVVVTWGWAGSDVLPPGSSTVEIVLEPDGDGTLVRLTHRDLPESEVASQDAGWRRYLPRLAAAAEGIDVGADPGL